MAMPITASATISQKMPATPMKCDKIGPATPAEIKRGGSGDAAHPHRLGGDSLARQTGEQPQNDRADRAGTLQHAANNDASDRGGNRRDRAADAEQYQAQDDHRLAAKPVGQEAEGDLQQALRQAVDTERLADEIGGGARQLLGIGGEHRVDHEKAE